MTTIQGTSNRFYESVSGFGSMDNHGYGCGSASGYGAPSQPPLSPPPVVLGLASRLVQGTPRHPATVVHLVTVQRLAKVMALAVVQAATMVTVTANPKPKGPNYAAPI